MIWRMISQSCAYFRSGGSGCSPLGWLWIATQQCSSHRHKVLRYTNSNALLFVRAPCCSFCCARAAYALILKSSDCVSYSSRFIFRHRKMPPASFWYHTCSSKVLIRAKRVSNWYEVHPKKKIRPRVPVCRVSACATNLGFSVWPKHGVPLPV